MLIITDCSPIKRERELSVDRRETGKSDPTNNTSLQWQSCTE